MLTFHAGRRWQDLLPKLPVLCGIKSVNLASDKEIHYFIADNLIREDTIKLWVAPGRVPGFLSGVHPLVTVYSSAISKSIS